MSDGTSPAANKLGFLYLWFLTDEEGEDSEECTTDRPIGHVYGRPKQNGVWKRVKWEAVGCVSGGAGNSTDGFMTFPIATGVTTYTVSKYQHFTKPAVYNTYFQGSDGYFNICLTTDRIGSIMQKNGRLFCTVLQSARVDGLTFRIKQTTKIIARPPAYVCPGGSSAPVLGADPVCTDWRPPLDEEDEGFEVVP